MRVDVAFTPAEQVSAHVGIVVDVIRATSSIAQALASGYERVLCCAEIDEARALREELGDEAVVGGERNAIVVDGFDVGASPREFAGPPKARTLILTTTNGTRAILTAASECDVVLLGSLLNLSAVADAARRETGDVAVVCSGFKGTFALDDAYCAGRIVDAIGGEPSDAAIAASTLAARVAGSARRAERAHVRAARPRGRHPPLRAGGLPLGRPAFHRHERCRSGDTGGP